MGHRARGLLRGRRLLDLLPPRPRPQPRLSLGRGRPARHLRPRSAPVLRARALERPRPDPEGAPVRPHQRGGQPRRGRQGSLLLPRRHADRLVPEGAVQVPAGRVPVRAAAPRRTARGRGATRSSSWPTPASSTTTATSTCTWSTPRRRPTTSSSASRSPTAARKRPRCTCCRRCGSATPGAGGAAATSTPTGPRSPHAGPAALEAVHPTLGRFTLVAGAGPDGRPPELLFTDNETNTERLFGTPNQAPYVKDAFHDRVVGGRESAVNPAGSGTKAAARYRLALPAGGSATLRLRLAPAGEMPAEPLGAGFDATFAARVREADEFYAAAIPAGLERRRARGRAPGLRRPALVEAVLQLRRARLARRRPHPTAAAGLPR